MKGNKNPYSVILNRHVTEKSVVLEGLKDNKNNRCIARCQAPKYVFRVAPDATKPEIKQAIEEIYADQNVKVRAVNTTTIKRKPRRVRGRQGMTAGGKKAVVTFEAGDSLDNV